MLEYMVGKMKTLLVSLNAKYCHTNPAVRNLKKILTANGVEASFCEYSINDEFTELLGKLYLQSADLYAFSCYIWNIELVKRLVQELKSIKPGCKVLLGGPEVSYTAAERFKTMPVDGIFCGEAEEQITASVLFLSGQTKTCPNGLAIPSSPDALYQTVRDMRLVSSAYSEKDVKSGRLLYVEASRGCPFSCAYCLSASTKEVRWRDAVDVLGEIDHLVNAGAHLIKFTDRTFNCSEKTALHYFQTLAENYPDTAFHFEIYPGLLTDTILEFLKTVPGGKFQFEIGIQTVNREALAAISRKEETQESLARIEKLKEYRNIHLHLDLIAGLPFDTMEDVKASFNAVYPCCDNLQLGFLKLLSGAPIEAVCRRQHYVFSDNPPYEVRCCDGFTFDEILKLKQIENTVEVFFNSGHFKNAVSFLLPYFEDPFTMYRQLADSYSNGTKVSHQTLYEILYLFGKSIRHVPAEALKEHIRLDYFTKYHNYPQNSLKKTYPESFLLQCRRFLSNRDRVREALPYLNDSDIVKIYKNADIHAFTFGMDERQTILLFDYKYDKITDITNLFALGE